jgi:hypothetical protein
MISRFVPPLAAGGSVRDRADQLLLKEDFAGAENLVRGTAADRKAPRISSAINKAFPF